MLKQAQTIIEIDTSDYPVYNSEDLAYFQEILGDMLEDLRDLNGAPLPDKQERLLKVRLAAALFKVAEGGERDPQALKRSALATLGAKRGSSPSV